MKILGIEVSGEADSMYIRFSDEPISHSVELSPDVILDLAENDVVVGVDLQHVSALQNEGQVEQVANSGAPTEQLVRLQLVHA